MKKNRLTKQILLALAMAAVVPAGQAWAEMSHTIDGDSIEIKTNETVTSGTTFEGNELGSFKNVIINYTPTGDAGSNRAMGIYSANYDLSSTNIKVTVNDGNGTSNNDGLHLTNHFPGYHVRSYTADIFAENSDALNLSHDITSNDKEDSMVYIGNPNEPMGEDGNGDLTVYVENGNGIRANASVQNDIVNGITIEGNTNITLESGFVTSRVVMSNEVVDGLIDQMAPGAAIGGSPFKDQISWIAGEASYHTAAVYAGDDMFNLNYTVGELLDGSGILEELGDLGDLEGIVNNFLNGLRDKRIPLGQESQGNGQIILNGATNINLGDKAAGSYGIFAGKNGEIYVNGNLKITSSAEKTYGIAAANKNLIYGDSMDVTAELTGFVGLILSSKLPNDFDDSGNPWESEPSSSSPWPEISTSVNVNLDNSDNRHGTSVVLEDNIDVNIDLGEDTGGHAFYAEGIDDTKAHNQNSIVGNLNHLYVVGDVEAENGGLIDLHVGAEQNYLNGDIKAYGTAAASENGESAQSAKIEITKNATINLVVEHALAGQGTIAAANGGIVNLELGANSSWGGRADDYQDAASADWAASHAAAIENAFDGETISSNGTVNLILGQNAMWNVTGQSWVTSLQGNDSLIFLDGDNTGGHSLHIGELSGENTFIMNVRPNESGDMLYVKKGTSDTQHLVINNRDEVLENMEVGDAVRFATVHSAGGGFMDGEIQDNSSMSAGMFGSHTRINDAGVFNVDFGIEYHTYGEDVKGDKAGEEAETANDVYNGDSFNADKPGSDYIEDNYLDDGNTVGQSLYAAEDNASDRDALQDGTQNVYIVRQANTLDNVSDAGKTILAMSKVNYSNAVYMDRLNKRMGEARYIDGDDGLWVRMRHDRIGKDDAFRSMNTMFELGYDWHAKGQKDGEHRQGVAFDYMRGTADYKNVAGDGDVRRAGVWLYDTWLGDKGHYSDYVVKYGRLSNDFDIYALSKPGEKISGNYDNDVWSVSAEYGRKKDIGNDWYFEPQVQAQYAYVTSADYTTSQGTKVELDGIDSLIGRAGFRLGRDTSEGNTVYFKADILHEFLGDQSIRAMDATGTLSTTYENEGTWYDVGFGFSHKMGEDSYLFLDVEHSFGNDNEDTYQVNIGLNRAF